MNNETKESKININLLNKDNIDLNNEWIMMR